MDQVAYDNTPPPRFSVYFNEATDSIYHSGTVRGTEVSSSGNVLFKYICHWKPSGPLQNKTCNTSEISILSSS